LSGKHRRSIPKYTAALMPVFVRSNAGLGSAASGLQPSLPQPQRNDDSQIARALRETQWLNYPNAVGDTSHGS
jgi:hypothetical protein